LFFRRRGTVSILLFIVRWGVDILAGTVIAKAAPPKKQKA